ncbi:MAG TPA: hypothetical protein DDY37_00125, partial [Legionella sp.]|nr:hypothetical protein [Legionella sp.]
LIQKLSESGLQHLLVTGDTCTPELKALCEKYSIYLWNGYGPTEATFGLSLLCVNGLALYDDGEQTIVPIGKPWGLDVHYLIINQTLHIDSPYLTPGYLQMERNTSEWGNTSTGKNLVRWFNTNDVFSEQDGFLFYKGRSQPNGFCKVSGVKITTDPIEHLLNHYHLVNNLAHLQAAVVIKPYLGQLRPFAYVVVFPRLDAKTSKAIQDHLRLKLKKEAIPLLVSLDALPRMPSSDKINRQALLTRKDDLDAWFIDDSQTDEKPLFLETIRTIWQDVLQRENIPDNIEFLFLGGNSLDAQEMVRLIQQQIDPTYAYQQLLALKTVTIQAITQSLSHGNGSSAPPINQASIRALMIRPEASAKDNIFFLPALLGEGYFSYRELAAVLSEYTKKSIYGLSDPSIHDSRLLPSHMGEAVQREIAAIKTIQPEGPYSLLGFSYGGTKAYYVAAQLVQDGECIENLYIMDSFPPMLYQALNASAHLKLLKPLLQFIVMTLTNSFYGEHIQLPKRFNTYATQAPSEQVASAFSHLRHQLQNPLSHCALNLAEQHLSFLRNAALPATKLSIWPTLYFTKRKQPYLNIINQVGLSDDSTDYRYFRWNHYFTDITRCGIELDCEHLGALDSSHRQPHQKGPEAYWTRPINDVPVNSRVRPTRFFRVNQHTATHDISVFLDEHTKRQFITQLDRLGLTARVFSYEQDTEKHESTDKHFNTITSIFVTVPPNHQEAVYALLEQHHIKQKKARLTAPSPQI